MKQGFVFHRELAEDGKQSFAKRQPPEPAAVGEHFLTQEQVDSRFMVDIDTRKHTHS